MGTAPALSITRRSPERHRTPDAQLRLPFDVRSRSRFRARLSSGEEVGVVLERGQILRGGDLVLTNDGRLVEVCAADEQVSTARARDARGLARVAYHLGNRHVALQVGPDWLRYGHDHVLDDMVRGLGAEVTVEDAPFEPEPGAYQSADGATSYAHAPHAHSHPHTHAHLHSQGHAHDHDEG